MKKFMVFERSTNLIVSVEETLKAAYREIDRHANKERQGDIDNGKTPAPLASYQLRYAVKAEKRDGVKVFPRFRLSISPGNRKMGLIPSVSLPPVITCRRNAPCVKECYACKLCRIYPAVKKAYSRNYDIYLADPDSYFAQLKNHMSANKYFRVHVSGDVPDPVYFSRLVDTVTACPDCNVLMFTKQFEIVNAYINNGGIIPVNFKIIFSNWNGWNCDNPHNFPCTNVIFKDTVVPDTWKICGGNCSDCVCRGTGCWTINPGETIAFYKH